MTIYPENVTAGENIMASWGDKVRSTVVPRFGSVGEANSYMNGPDKPADQTGFMAVIGTVPHVWNGQAFVKVANDKADGNHGHTAAEISASPHGSISSKTVQNQLQELENEVDAVISSANTLAGRVTTAEADIGKLEGTSWTNLSLINGWANYGGGRQVAQYRQVGDEVQFRGTIKHAGNITVAFEDVLVIPSASRRIKASDNFPGTSTGNASGMYFHVQTNGSVRVYNLPFDNPDNKSVGALGLSGIRYAV
jgi:hypothetical protein